MRELVFTEESVNDYYRNGFPDHLQRYFEITKSGQGADAHSFVLHPSDVKGIPGNPASHSAENNFVFSGLFLHMILIPQAINAICGKDQLWDFELVRDFYRASGWPEFSAGLGGPYADVRRFLKEADLYPESTEACNYIRMLEVVAPFIQGEIRRFLLREDSMNLDRTAYDRLCRNVEGRVEEVMNWLNIQVRGLCEELKSA